MYDGKTSVLDDINLEIQQGEFFTLLGPSGCGKTTLLRIIAGFLQQNTGTITIGAERIDTVPAHKRNIGMVFQDYAIFPHLNVWDNVAFGLKARKTGGSELETRVREALATVRLEGFEKRMPSALSGGQQQRVGIARALAIRPRLLLMDEPLSNLDAKLRVEMREDIRDIQRTLGITTIYVTHDQEEALAISDRICVLHGGIIQQVGRPTDIYWHPTRLFTAGFIGTMNFLPGILEEGRLRVGSETVALAGPGGALPPTLAATLPNGPVTVAIRPEDLAIGNAPAHPGNPGLALAGHIEKTTFLGREATSNIKTELGRLTASMSRVTGDSLARTGIDTTVFLPLGKIAIFAEDGGRLASMPEGAAA